MIEWSTIPPISTKPTTTRMVNNSTNINKTNNHLNGQQYRQYQQNQQPPEWSTIPPMVELLTIQVVVGFVDIGGIVDHSIIV
jgi:hypothetical protein